MKLFVLLMLALAFAGCSSSTDVSVNNPPEISFAFTKLAVPKGIDVDLAVMVTDEDEDPLTVQWQASSGGLDSSDQGKTIMTWTPPASVGSHTITATVSDGKTSATATLSLQTGTPWFTNITGGSPTLWTNALSPYILSESEPAKFRIAGSTLVIGPGVTVYIDSEDLEFNVNGTLKTTGSESQPVRILPNHRTPSPGFWLGIWAVDIQDAQVGFIDLDYTELSYGQYNIRADDRSNVDLFGCRSSHAQDAGIFFRSKGMLIVQDCDISENEGIGINIVKPSDFPEDLEMQVTVANSNIRYNGTSGVEINLMPEVGQDAFISFTNDSISFNEFHGINLLRGGYPHISNCAIFFNDIFRVNNGFNVRVDPGFFGNLSSIDARNNFWGTAYAVEDSTEIARLIYDKTDNPAVPKVRFVPWCDTYPCP